MGKKKNAKEAELEVYRRLVKEDAARWAQVREYGCNDPTWTDGVNMNLCKNHIHHAKKNIMDLCYDLNVPLPEEYFIKTPPEVSKKYMAALRKGSAAAEDPLQAERLEKIKKYEYGLTAACPEYKLELSFL